MMARSDGASTALDVTRGNAEEYGEVEATWTKRGERRILDMFLAPGTSVLEIGCGTGRITRELVRRHARIVACDVNPLAVAKLRASIDADSDVSITVGDARSLPFADEAFEAVVFAFNGLDFIHPEVDRFRAVSEIARVLRRGGVFIFSSHNPLGTLLSPRGLQSPAEVVRRARYLVSGNVFRAYFRYRGELLLYQALPRRVIADIVARGPLQFVYATNCAASTTRLSLLTLFSSWPYYVFRKV
jgi:ubiquinone/menaquinone biosynthesis C-methylase UbiE